jgi:hypothetical protein
MSPDDQQRPSRDAGPGWGEPRRRGTGRRVARWFRRVVGIVVLLAMAAAAWIGVRGWLAKAHLEEAASLVPRLEQQARLGTPGSGDVRALQAETGAARNLTGDPVWSGAQHLPWLGDDLSAVRASARAVDTVATGAVPPLLTIASALDPETLRPRDGHIDLQRLDEARDLLRRADRALMEARSMLAPYVGQGTRSGSLTVPVQQAVTQLADELGRLADLADTATRAADLLPQVSASTVTRPAS